MSRQGSWRDDRSDSPIALGIVVGVLVACAGCFTWWLVLTS